MSAVSKPVAISPPAAAAAGCTAQCPGEQLDFSNGWLRTYTLSAFPATGWRFVKFTWDKTRVTQSGSTPQGTGESSYNPSDYNDGVAEQRTDFTATMFQENLISNVTAIFEPDAPATYTVTATASPLNGGIVQVGSAAAGSTSTLANITAGSSIQVTATAAAGFAFSHWSDAGLAAHSITVNSNMTLTAYFTRTPTHLLVNSSTAENPAKLVYDPATNKLVADY